MSRQLAGRLVRIAVVVGASTFTYEFLKQFIRPGITIWQSHSVTIVYSAAIASLAAYFALRKYDKLTLNLHREICERKRVETALKIADQRKNDFMAVLAHELRNPLAPIRNAVEVMQLCGDDIQKLHWARGVIDRQSQLLGCLTEELLDVSRIACGKVQLAIQPVDLAFIVTSAVEAARPLIDGRGHRLKVELPSGPLPLKADAARMTQVVLNLLNNAAKFTPPGGAICVSACREARFIALRIRDNGKGIAPDALAHVFDLFMQAAEKGESAGGLGIGLSVVRRLVDLHAGTVEVASPIEDGHGTEFVVRLIAADESVVEDAARQSVESGVLL
jgi:signal transduction histidine kinase